MSSSVFVEEVEFSVRSVDFAMLEFNPFSYFDEKACVANRICKILQNSGIAILCYPILTTSGTLVVCKDNRLEQRFENRDKSRFNYCYDYDGDDDES